MLMLAGGSSWNQERVWWRHREQAPSVLLNLILQFCWTQCVFFYTWSSLDTSKLMWYVLWWFVLFLCIYSDKCKHVNMPLLTRVLVLFLFCRKCLSCVFYGGARQRAVIAVCLQWWRTANAKDCRAFLPTAHGKGKRLLCVFLPVHGKGCNVSFGASAISCFSLPCTSPWRTAKKVHRALSEESHGNGSLPCKLLPCALCRAPRWKMHGKDFAVRF
jgi:hypothetical protein